MRFHSAVPIGHGGTGRVLRAFDAERGHEVALKLLHVSTPSLTERLRREAAALARLDHPHVARVYSSGEQDGQPYIAMQLIDGEPLDRAVARLDLERRVALLLPVIDAVQAAHRLGLIHRDLKPGNILVETRADGGLHPYVVDFGLVHESTSTQLTAAGEFLGTPGYLSPEQAAGEPGIDRRSDVFSLGAILYELACARPPFQADTLAGTIVNVLRNEPPSPARINPKVPAALARIIGQCLEKAPARRYQSARELGDDLAAWLDGRPVRARRQGALYRLRRWCRHSPGRAAAVLFACAIPLTAGSVWLHGRMDSARAAHWARTYTATALDIERDLALAAMRPDQDMAGHKARLGERLEPLERAMTSSDRLVRRAAAEPLGRALFALGRTDAAREVLERAWREGSGTTQLAGLLGRTLERIHAERLAELAGVADTELRDAQSRRLRRDTLEPALALFEQAAAGGDAEAAYARALLAFHAGDGDLALRLLAGIDAPTLSADLLAAQLQLDRVLGLLDDGGHDPVLEALATARQAYEHLLHIARSLPAAHLGQCRIEMLALRLTSRTGTQAPEAPERLPACDRAVTIDRDDPAIQSSRALGYSAIARRQVMLGRSPDAALAIVREAADAAGPDSDAERALGQALLSASEYRRSRGLDDGEALLRQAEQVLGEASARRPGDAALLTELAAVQQLRAIHGRGDKEAAFELAAATLTQAQALHDTLGTRLRLGEVLAWWGNERHHAGHDPNDVLTRAIETLTPAHTALPADLRILQRLAFAHWTRGQYQAATGQPADDDLAAAERCYDLILAADPERHNTRFNRLSVQLTLARHRLQRGDDAAEVLDRARAGFTGLAERDELGLVVQAGALNLLEARQRQRGGADAGALFMQARSRLLRALDHPDDRAAAAAQLADLVVAAPVQALPPNALSDELVRMEAMRREQPDNHVLRVQQARLLALAARRDPARWQDRAVTALDALRRTRPDHLRPYEREFATVAALP